MISVTVPVISGEKKGFRAKAGDLTMVRDRLPDLVRVSEWVRQMEIYSTRTAAGLEIRMLV